MKDQRGVVYLETLVAFVPVFLFFLGTLQIADAGAAHLIVKHAATVAARAAVVVLPDDGVYYNDKDNAQLHQFSGLRRADIEHAADLVLGANARLDGDSDNVSIGFSAPPVPTPAGETNAEKSRSFGERLLDTSTRGRGEQNMRELVTARVNAKYRCLVAALCPRDLNMIGQASLVYQGARYIYEARTNGARNAAHSHNSNGGLVNTAKQNPDPDPNEDAADGDTDPIANATPSDSNNSSRRGPQPPNNSNSANANNSNSANANNSNSANANNSNSANANNSNSANANNSNSANANNSNSASASNASAGNSNASNSQGANRGTSNSSGANRGDGPSASKPQIVARPPADGSPTASANPPSKPSSMPSSSSSASSGDKSNTAPTANGDQRPEVAAGPPPKRDDPRVPVAPRSEGTNSAQGDTSRPGRGAASPRGPPSSQSVVSGTNKGDSGSRTVSGRASSSGTRSPSTVLASAASRPTRDPAIRGRDSQGRIHLVVTNPACFVAGTQIRTPHGAKPIETIQPGDHVLAFDLATQQLVERPVAHSFTRTTHALIDLEVAAAGATSIITGTPEHPFFVPALAAYVPMGELTPGTALITHNGLSAQARSARLRTGDFTVFNFQVAEHHNYFVAAASGNQPGVLVHNAGCDGPRPSSGDLSSPREPVSNSPLANQNISGQPGPHQVFQVGNAWREPLPEYRNRAPEDVPVDGYRDYRMVEVVDADGRVIAQREETYVQPANGNPYWMQRGSASARNGGRMERASDELNRDLIASGEITAAFNTQNASGQGFDGVTLSYDADGNPRVTLVEVKDYPGRYIGLDELSAVNQNLDQNLDALRLLVQDEQAAETLGLTPEQLDAVRQALDAGNVGIEIRPGPGTRVGAGRGTSAGDATRPRVVDALGNMLNERGLSGGVSTRTIPQNVVDRVPGNPGLGTRPRFYDLARDQNGEISHEGVHRANEQLGREAQN